MAGISKTLLQFRWPTHPSIVVVRRERLGNIIVFLCSPFEAIADYSLRGTRVCAIGPGYRLPTRPLLPLPVFVMLILMLLRAMVTPALLRMLRLNRSTTPEVEVLVQHRRKASPLSSTPWQCRKTCFCSSIRSTCGIWTRQVLGRGDVAVRGMALRPKR